MNQNYINHIVFVVDNSISIAGYGLERDVPKVFDSQIKYLARRSKELDQETRVTVYEFGSEIKCTVFDKDVLRLPLMEGNYSATGHSTRLIDATSQALEELAETSQRYGDHSFLVYVLTDGEENASYKVTSSGLSRQIDNLPDNWTLAVYVPNARGISEAKRFGFPVDNIDKWSTTAEGIKEVGRGMERATESYFQARKSGIRGTKSLFKLDLSKLTASKVSRSVPELPRGTFVIEDVVRDVDAKSFVQNQVGLSYKNGHVFYELTKKEKVQSYKQICLRSETNGKVYGGREARELLGLPDNDVVVIPEDFKNFKIFVQSTAPNRKLLDGTEALYLY